jgi:hypothetical protein
MLPVAIKIFLSVNWQLVGHREDDDVARPEFSR